jgi:hypothetical protein
LEGELCWIVFPRIEDDGAPLEGDRVGDGKNATVEASFQGGEGNFEARTKLVLAWQVGNSFAVLGEGEDAE